MIGISNHQSSSRECSSGYNSASSSGCGSGGNLENESETTRTLDVVDQLHDLFRHMSIFDETPENNREPIPPNNFLQAVGKLNPMFEGECLELFRFNMPRELTRRHLVISIATLFRQPTARCP